LVTEADAKGLREQINTHFEKEYQASLERKPDLKSTRDPTYRGSRSLTHKWKDMQFSQWGEEPAHTGYDTEKLLQIGRATVDLPSDFNVHPRLRKMFIEPKLKSIENGKIDWATAEAMALGSLAFEGFNSRLVGEDSERGTFSQRHGVFTDQVTSKKYCSLAQSSYMKANLMGRMTI